MAWSAAKRRSPSSSIEVGEERLEVVERVGPVGMAGQLDHLPAARGRGRSRPGACFALRSSLTISSLKSTPAPPESCFSSSILDSRATRGFSNSVVNGTRVATARAYNTKRPGITARCATPGPAPRRRTAPGATPRPARGAARSPAAGRTGGGGARCARRARPVDLPPGAGHGVGVADGQAGERFRRTGRRARGPRRRSRLAPWPTARSVDAPVQLRRAGRRGRGAGSGSGGARSGGPRRARSGSGRRRRSRARGRRGRDRSAGCAPRPRGSTPASRRCSAARPCDGRLLLEPGAQRRIAPGRRRPRRGAAPARRAPSRPPPAGSRPRAVDPGDGGVGEGRPAGRVHPLPRLDDVEQVVGDRGALLRRSAWPCPTSSPR